MNSGSRNIDRSGFVYARLRYHPVEWWRQRTPEIPWHHDYPSGDTMLPDALSRLTKVHTTRESYQIVDIDSKELFKFPFVYLAEPGLLDLLPADVKNLREYLDRGGFLFIDDFRGNERDNSEMENLIVQLQKLYPDRNLVPLPRTPSDLSVRSSKPIRRTCCRLTEDPTPATHSFSACRTIRTAF